jgi:hypothetical protein
LVRPGNSAEDEVTIYWLLGYTYFALNRPEETAGSFRRLLAIQPDFQPGQGVAPNIRARFAEVYEEWNGEGRPGAPPPTPVNIQHRSPAQAERGEAVTLRATVVDPGGRLERLVLAYRQGTSDVFQRIDTTADGGDRIARIPGADVRPPLVEYYFEGLDSLNLPIATRGDVAAPLRIAVPEPGRTIWGRWWFWLTAAVVIGGAITLAVVLSRGGGQDEGTFVITVRP